MYVCVKELLQPSRSVTVSSSSLAAVVMRAALFPPKTSYDLSPLLSFALRQQLVFSVLGQNLSEGRETRSEDTSMKSHLNWRVPET